MRASHETFEKVAKCCSEFLPVKKDTVSNSVSDTTNCISCECCKHFDNEKFCKLDIYDRIVKEHQF